MKNNRVYLAGPDVFFPDVAEISTNLKSLCSKHGLEGVFPLDSEIVLEDQINEEAKVRNGLRIYEGNPDLIRSSAAILANISPFRSPSADLGTTFEMGFGKGLGLIVAGYTKQKILYKNRVVPDGLMIEDFGMIDNLMIQGAACGMISETPEEAIEYLASMLDLIDKRDALLGI